MRPLSIDMSFSIILDFKASSSFWHSASSSARISLSLDLDLRSFTTRENKRLPITTPFIEGPAFSEAFFTSPALSPNMARRSFSSGVGSVSPFGVILPINISPSLTSAPTRISPFSSKSFVASALTLGISLVSSSNPRLVSRTSRVNSSIWIEVKMSSFTIFSEITIASS